ncbi:hypothetical protein [uncultured Dokdonia sp.]|uniref:hypothetical protein n=1 Tax=uncultured Dokdonia sp. TaxID=575653 RepID=UPI002618B84B|nr:hypothetical protein [uncultured Dokdonia sp.]
MSKEKLEIVLKYVDDEYVDLGNMSIKALESFMSVTNSLKLIAEQSTDEITFTIKKSSAYASVNSTPNVMQLIYKDIDTAINGQSEDEVITSNLRNIQQQISNATMKYQFMYADVNLSDRLKRAKRIKKKRKTYKYEYEPMIVSGLFNSIGGADPNYHFDYGNNQKTVVDCTIKDVTVLKEFLYETISCLVIKKFTKQDDSKTTHNHCAILAEDQVPIFNKLIRDLNASSELFNRLELIHDFAENKKYRIENLAILLQHYSYFFNDVNEYKTLLIITKGLENHVLIRDFREKLLHDFKLTLKKL